MTPQRTHWLLTRLTAVAVALAGLAMLVLGLQHTSAFGGDTSLVGRLPRGGAPVVVTAPGMTELAGATVKVRAASSAMSTPVFIGVGRADDVEAYLGTAGRTEVTALEESGVLRIDVRPGEAALPDPAGVDVWTASVRAGGIATLTWPRTPGRWRLVIATDGRTPPSAAEFTWSGSNGASVAPALIAVGAVLLVVGVAALLAMRSGRLFAASGSDEDDDVDEDEGDDVGDDVDDDVDDDGDDDGDDEDHDERDDDETDASVSSDGAVSGPAATSGEGASPGGARPTLPSRRLRRAELVIPPEPEEQVAPSHGAPSGPERAARRSGRRVAERMPTAEPAAVPLPAPGDDDRRGDRGAGDRTAVESSPPAPATDAPGTRAAEVIARVDTISVQPPQNGGGRAAAADDDDADEAPAVLPFRRGSGSGERR